MLTASRCVLTLILLSVYTVTAIQGGRCNGQVSPITVTAEGGILYSNGYPQYYENSDSCGWLLSTMANSQVIQIETLDIELEGELEGGSCQDYIAAYDGTNDQSPLLKKWCGTDKAVVQSTGQSLLLRFESNPTINRKGFAIAYHSITPYDSSCVDETPKVVSVGTTPVIYNFRMGKNTTSTCQWRFDPQNSQRLVLTAVKSSDLLICDEGYFAFYDGVDTSAPEVLRWCGGSFASDPFSAFYPSGSVLLVMYLNWSKKKYSNYQLLLKTQTQPAQEICNENLTPIFEMEEDAAPIFMAFPFATTAGGASCPVQFLNKKNVGGFRVDVLAENNQAASCNSTAVSVYKGHTTNSSSSLSSECWRDMRTIFLYFSQKITVAPAPGKTSVLMINPQSYRCAGWNISVLVFRFGGGITETIPWNDQTADARFQNYCISRFILKTDEEEDYPMVHFEGTFEDNRDGGDIITVYDGETIHDPVIYVLNETGYFSHKWAVGSKRKMLVEFSANGLHNRGRVKLKTQSMPVSQAADFCYWGKKELKAKSSPQNLSSINYPGWFPVDFTCRYEIRTETEGDVVHLEILDAEFGVSCGDQLNIYDGDNIYHRKRGLVCKGNPNHLMKYEATGDIMTLRFISDSLGYSGSGWNVQYYSAPPTPDSEGDEEDHTAAIVGGVLGTIILILVIVIIYCAVTRRRTGSAAI